MDDHERVKVLAARLREYDPGLYSALQAYLINERKEEKKPMSDEILDDLENDPGGFGFAISEALGTLEGAEKERFKQALKSGAWVKQLTENARQQPGQAGPSKTRDRLEWEQEQKRLGESMDLELSGEHLGPEKRALIPTPGSPNPTVPGGITSRIPGRAGRPGRCTLWTFPGAGPRAAPEISPGWARVFGWICAVPTHSSNPAAAALPGAGS
jgi:hypothetical protein